MDDKVVDDVTASCDVPPPPQAVSNDRIRNAAAQRARVRKAPPGRKISDVNSQIADLSAAAGYVGHLTWVTNARIWNNS